MARYSDIFLFVFMVNIGLSTLGSIPLYYSSGVAYTIGAGVNYLGNPQLQPGPVLNTIGCNVAGNQSVTCQPPSALSNPAFLSGQVFGWIYGGLIAIASLVAAPYFVYNLVQSFVNFVPLAGLIAAGLAIVYYYFWLLFLTGRYFEQ
jgi:hypothetical protein